MANSQPIQLDEIVSRASFKALARGPALVTEDAESKVFHFENPLIAKCSAMNGVDGSDPLLGEEGVDVAITDWCLGDEEPEIPEDATGSSVGM